MKKTIQLILLVGLAAISTGCASPYMVDRGRDAADIFTATVGVGAGAKARIGPVQVATLWNSDYFGLRGGVLISPDRSYKDKNHVYIEDVASLIPLPSQCDKVPSWVPWWGWETFRPDCLTERYRVVRDRNKGQQSASLILPFAVFPDNVSSLTQIEVVCGIGPSVRLGFNPGELLDFILGWTTIDIYGDDLEARKRRERIEPKPDGDGLKPAP